MRPIRDVIPAGLAVPHMGWNALRFPAERPRSPIFAALEEGEHVYFVHSYAGFACGEGLTAWTEYGAPLTAAVRERKRVRNPVPPGEERGCGTADSQGILRIGG